MKVYETPVALELPSEINPREAFIVEASGMNFPNTVSGSLSLNTL